MGNKDQCIRPAFQINVGNSTNKNGVCFFSLGSMLSSTNTPFKLFLHQYVKDDVWLVLVIFYKEFKVTMKAVEQQYKFTFQFYTVGGSQGSN